MPAAVLLPKGGTSTSPAKAGTPKRIADGFGLSEAHAASLGTNQAVAVRLALYEMR